MSDLLAQGGGVDLRRSSIAPAASQRPDAKPEVADYLLDVPKGVAGGAVGFGRSLVDLGIGGANLFGAGLEYTSRTSIEDSTKTFVGDVTRSITQYAIGLKTGGILLTKAGWAGSIVTGTRMLAKKNMARHFVQSAVADLLAFGGTQERLSNVIEQVPQLRNPVTGFLAANEDDNELVGRMKNILEGLGMGAVSDPFFHALYRHRHAATLLDSTTEAILKADGDEKAVKKVLENAVKSLPQGDMEVAYTVPRAALSKAKALGMDNALTREQVVQRLKNPEAVEQVLEAFKDINLRDADPATVKQRLLDVMVDKTNINVTKFTSPEDAADVAALLSDIYGISKRPVPVSMEAINTLADTWKDSGWDTVLDAAQAMGISPEQAAAVTKATTDVLDIQWALIKKQGLRWAATPTSENKALLEKLFTAFGPWARAKSQLSRTQGLSLRTLRESASPLPDNLPALFRSMDDNPKAFVDFIANLNATQSWEGAAKTRQAYGMTGRIIDVANEVAINNMLMSASSNVVDVSNSLFMSFYLPFERALGSGMTGNRQHLAESVGAIAGIKDSLLSIFGLARRADGMPNVGQIIRKNYRKALKEGLGQLDPGHGSTNEFGRAISSASMNLDPESSLGHLVDGIGKMVNIPVRIRVGSDEMIKGINFWGWAKGTLSQQAIERGMTKDQASTWIASQLRQLITPEGVVNMDHHLARSLLEKARDPTWTTELGYGFGKALQKMTAQVPIVRSISPFVRVPTNLARAAWKRTPGLQYLQRQWTEDLMSKVPERVAKARGEQAMGAGIWALAVIAANEGLITGTGPQNPDQIRTLRETGWQPLSIKVGDKYYGFNRTDPFGMVFGMAADFARIGAQAEDDPETNSLAVGMSLALTRNLTNKTYFMGISEALDAVIHGGDQAERFIQNRMGTFVPMAVTQVGGALVGDEYMREARGWVDTMLRRLPGFSSSLPPRRNVLGEAVSARDSWLPLLEGSRVANLASPIPYSEERHDDIFNEMADTGRGFTQPRKVQRGLDLTRFRDGKGNNAYDFWLQQIGKSSVGSQSVRGNLDRLFNSATYRRLKDDNSPDSRDERANQITRVLFQHRQAAFANVLKAFPDLARAIEEQTQERHRVRRLRGR